MTEPPQVIPEPEALSMPGETPLPDAALPVPAKAAAITPIMQFAAGFLAFFLVAGLYNFGLYGVDTLPYLEEHFNQIGGLGCLAYILAGVVMAVLKKTRWIGLGILAAAGGCICSILVLLGAHN